MADCSGLLNTLADEQHRIDDKAEQNYRRSMDRLEKPLTIVPVQSIPVPEVIFVPTPTPMYGNGSNVYHPYCNNYNRYGY